jgi:hypothetical protein
MRYRNNLSLPMDRKGEVSMHSTVNDALKVLDAAIALVKDENTKELLIVARERLIKEGAQ